MILQKNGLLLLKES